MPSASQGCPSHRQVLLHPVRTRIRPRCCLRRGSRHGTCGKCPAWSPYISPSRMACADQIKGLVLQVRRLSIEPIQNSLHLGRPGIVIDRRSKYDSIRLFDQIVDRLHIVLLDAGSAVSAASTAGNAAVYILISNQNHIYVMSGVLRSPRELFTQKLCVPLLFWGFPSESKLLLISYVLLL